MDTVWRPPVPLNHHQMAKKKEALCVYWVAYITYPLIKQHFWMVWFLKQCNQRVLKKTMLCYVINNNEMHYVIFNPRVSHDTWTCAFIMGWKHFSFTVFFSRWSVQRAPTGHNLFTLSSSLADSWEESRRKLLSWSFRTRSDIPLSCAVIPSPYYHKAGSARSLWKKKNILTIWKTRKCTSWWAFFFSFFFFICGRCLLIFVKLESAVQANVRVGI